MKKNRKSDSANGTNKQPMQKKLTAAETFELEGQKVQDQINELKNVMKQEKILKMKEQTNSINNHWRSSTKNKQIYGYSDMVLEHYSKVSTTDGSNPPSSQLKQRPVKVDKENGDKIVTKGLNIKQKPSPPYKNAIESNLNRAIIEQWDEYKEINEFLCGIKMEKYREVFIENGIEDKETILELNESHLEQLGLPLGHKLKIMKKIKEIKKKEVPPPSQTSLVEQTSQASEKSSAVSNTQSESSNLLDGNYDEEKNNKEFQEALMAWRNGGKKDQPKEEKEPIIKSETISAQSKSKAKKTVRFSDAPVEELLIMNNETEEDQEDNVATELKPAGRTTNITEGMIAFKNVNISKKWFLFSEESTGSNCWNVDLLSTVDHASTSPRESVPISTPNQELKRDKELWCQWYKYVDKEFWEKDELTK